MNSIALVGKPNSGKSSLFNLLTKLNQKTANYTGVTVEKKVGSFKNLEIVDLPGLRSLRPSTQDEQIAQKEILNFASKQMPVLFVANGSQLEDSLTLFSEIADLQLPMAIVINYKDELKKNRTTVDLAAMESQVGCPVLLMNSKNGDGLEELKKILEKGQTAIPHTFCRSQFEEVDETGVRNTYIDSLRNEKESPSKEEFENLDRDFAQRQMLVSKVINSAVAISGKNDELLSRTKKLDKILLHPFWGILIFLAIMLVVFQAVFSLSTIPMDWIDTFFAGLSQTARSSIQPQWLADLISEGILPGFAGVLIFIPQIAVLFFLLGILEHSGYLTRISYISDNILRRFGLSGKSVVPLMSSWACAIPAIMSARMIEDPKERMAVILAAPLMTCSARLPVYTILIAVLIPDNGSAFFNLKGLCLLGLYLLGVISTLLVSWFVSRRLKMKSKKLWTMEMPLYRTPNWRNVFTNVFNKTKSFVMEAGKVIFLISIVLWLMASFSPKSDAFIEQKFQESVRMNSANNQQEANRESLALEYSYAGYMGKIIEPVIRPLGYDWKIGIALITSFAAREVFVGTLGTIYSIGSEEEETIVNKLKNERTPQGAVVYSPATSISLLLFYVFALQCMSTLAIVRKETGSWKYAGWQFLFMLALAYLSGLAAYQLIS